MSNLQLPNMRALPDGRLPQRKEHLVTEITNDSKKTRRWRPIVFRTAIACAALVAVFAVLSIVNVFGGNGPSMVDKAVAALAHPENVILHVKVVSSTSDKSGGVLTSTDESWVSNASPYLQRQILTSGDAPGVETGAAESGLAQIYDPATNTIYQYGQGTSKATDVNQPPDTYRDMILDLLQSGGAKEDGHETVDGRDAVRIVSTKDYGTGKDGTKYETVYLIDAKTSDPIEWRVTREGKDATLRFAAYEELPSTPENLALLSLAEQHSGAVLDTNQQDFEEATSRLYPNN